ncbi:MAG: hypothetical protein WA071_26770 [Undibacterium umbellatum]|uniref:hypothetical protein n=1 Tax=Undibacterium umbellatum TaxID=2762300 RepID=UPI003BB5D378
MKEPCFAIARPDLAAAMLAAVSSATEHSVWDVYGDDAGSCACVAGLKLEAGNQQKHEENS